MLYREHISQYRQDCAHELMATIKDRVTFFGTAVLVLIPVTLFANGIGYPVGANTNETDGLQGHLPMIAENGCNISLNSWYIFLTALVSFKLLIEIFRYIIMKVNYSESVALHFGGNYLLMPIAFVVFFAYT